jgi:hypothetical protein
VWQGEALAAKYRSQLQVTAGNSPSSLIDAFFGRTSASCATAISLLAVLGCMSIGAPMFEAKGTGLEATDVVSQEGKIPVQAGKDRIVYYPKPYGSPPNLELEDPSGVCEIVEQRETCFVVHFRSTVWGGPSAVTWKARGVQTTPLPDAGQGQNAPPPNQPPTPVAVQVNAH